MFLKSLRLRQSRVRIQNVDLKLLKDFQAGYYFDNALTAPKPENNINDKAVILTRDKKWGIRSNGEYSEGDRLSRGDYSGPESIPLDRNEYKQTEKAGDWAILVREVTKHFGFLQLAKVLKRQGKSNVKLSNDQYLMDVLDLTPPKVEVNYSYIFVNTKLFCEAYNVAKEKQKELLNTLARDLEFNLGVDYSKGRVYEILKFPKIFGESYIEVTDLK